MSNICQYLSMCGTYLLYGTAYCWCPTDALLIHIKEQAQLAPWWSRLRSCSQGDTACSRASGIDIYHIKLYHTLRIRSSKLQVCSSNSWQSKHGAKQLTNELGYVAKNDANPNQHCNSARLQHIAHKTNKGSIASIYPFVFPILYVLHLLMSASIIHIYAQVETR